MTELVLERHFDVSPEKVFDFVTTPEKIALWWGPENMHCPHLNMDMASHGPWSSTMRSQEGNDFHVSGNVLEVDPPKRLRFTWAWHDDQGQRGHESEVVFDIVDDGAGGTNFKLTHSGLADDESAQNHEMGWTSSFRKLKTEIQKS